MRQGSALSAAGFRNELYPIKINLDRLAPVSGREISLDITSPTERRKPAPRLAALFSFED
jgi:hypothetical protein